MAQRKKTPKMVTEFFLLVASRNFTAAERTLEGLRTSLKRVEWSQGYLTALRGMLSATRTNDDRYAFMKRLNLKGKSEAERMRREFSALSRETLQPEFDKGFFSAWTDYARALGEDNGLMERLKANSGNRVKESPEEEQE